VSKVCCNYGFARICLSVSLISVFANPRISVYDMRRPGKAEGQKSVILAIMSQKGGAGKTTLSLNLAAAMAPFSP